MRNLTCGAVVWLVIGGAASAGTPDAQVVTISGPTREETSVDHAYVVVPAVYTFKERGVAMREAAQMTIALQKGAGGWLIHGWASVGPRPKPVVPPKP